MNIPLNIIKPVSTKYLIKWFDEASHRWLTEDITKKSYTSLITSNPRKPRSYSKTANEWQNQWEKRGAVAMGGRTVFNTSNGNTSLGDIQELEDGSLMLYLDDLDNGSMVQILKTDFRGTLPKITLLKPIIVGNQTINITNGILTITP